MGALVSPEQLKFLNTMDNLRAYGIGEFVSLPQIVVCGDQSAGKSSVLEVPQYPPIPSLIHSLFYSLPVGARCLTQLYLYMIGNHRDPVPAQREPVYNLCDGDSSQTLGSWHHRYLGVGWHNPGGGGAVARRAGQAVGVLPLTQQF